MEALKDHFTTHSIFLQSRIKELIREEKELKTDYAIGLNNGMRLAYEAQLSYINDGLKLLLI